MSACPNCGGENSDQARFCQHCGTPLSSSEGAREVRKTVTVLFADVTGSTSLGERLDPESLRRVMRRFFDEMRSVLERHGGTVEKFIGDAVMAVFGIPTLHEDDALRAVRAAAGMREALEPLNAELQRDHGVTLAVRIGVDTGPVVAGDASTGETMVTGDAVNVAARLEQAAAPGEILIGDSTFRLVKDAVLAKALEPLTLKGKAQAVPAHRLQALRPGAEAIPRRLQSPMVGRDRELALLRLAFDRVAGEHTCHLATVLGAAGVGKSRLVEEFLRTAETQAEVLRGRCLSYGEGITFFPVVQAIKQAAGITDDEPADQATAKLEALVSGQDSAELIAQRVAQVIGLAAGSAVPEETAWAIRRLLEIMAHQRPLVLVFDDVHWAEPTFLDLVESIADLSRDSPLLVLCLARQELLDLRPAWGGGKLNATSIFLEPLTEPQCQELIANMLGRAQLAPDAQTRIAQAAEGNPLFVEELLAMLIDDGLLARDDGHWTPTGDLSTLTLPPTIRALLAARLDRLGHEERAVIERASVVGRVFYRGAVTALAPDSLRPGIPQHLTALIRRELIRPHPQEFAGEDTYRFRHILYRDAAYEAMPKETRAELHERFAAWLETAAGERAREFEEIIGYHLEQAHRYLKELGPLDERGHALAERAGRLLAPAGLRALARGDVFGATNLLGRALSLLPSGDLERIRILPELGAALLDLGDFERARELLEDAIREAAETGERASEVRARATQIMLATRTDPTATFAGAVAESERLVAVAEEVGDRDTLLYAWGILARMRIWSGDSAGAEEAVDRALPTAGSPEFERRVLDLHRAIFTATVWGATPVDRGLERWEAVLEEHHGPALEGWGWAAMAAMHAMAGRFDRALDLLDRARSRLEQLGQTVPVSAFHAGFMVHMLVGNPRGAVDALLPGTAVLTELGETGYLSTSAGMLAEGFSALGEYEEAEKWTKVSEETAAVDDVVSQSLWRSARARVLAQRGVFDEAERLAREAVGVLEGMDQISQLGDMLMTLGEVLQLAGRQQEAIPVIEDAIRRYELKGNVVSAGRARDLLPKSR